MNCENTTEDYEVGYGKPPKNTRFRKGVSGNPSGRRKKVRNLDAELSKELNASIIVNNGGKRKRISKLQGILKQLANKALNGDIRAARIVLAHYQQVLERVALLEAQQPSDIRTIHPKELTNEQLTWIIAQELKKMEGESGEGQVSSME